MKKGEFISSISLSLFEVEILGIQGKEKDEKGQEERIHLSLSLLCMCDFLGNFCVAG